MLIKHLRDPPSNLVRSLGWIRMQEIGAQRFCDCRNHRDGRTSSITGHGRVKDAKPISVKFQPLVGLGYFRILRCRTRQIG